jgi:hypothetical protein
MSRYRQFDRQSLHIRPLADRQHDLSLDIMVPLNEPNPLPQEDRLRQTALRIIEAKKKKRSVIVAMGAHVIRAGTTPHLVDLMERGFITHIACNGAGAIHDFELALIGQTCESVPRYISSGEFGLWRETSRLNEIVSRGARDGLGLGEAVGKEILEGDYPNKQFSLFAQAYRLGVPVTVHVGIGYDIVYEHGNCDGSAWGETSYRDFLIFTESVTNLEGGAYLSFGSAVMGPEVYLKALAMARNVAHRRGEKICHFTTLACDLIPIQGDFRQQAPKSDPQYYYRPYKTILVRTVADGGESFYVCGDHRHTVPSLHHFILEQAELS